MRTVLVLNRDRMGHGDAELGLTILGTCLRMLVHFKELEAVLLYNAGLGLATKVNTLLPGASALQNQVPCVPRSGTMLR